jgi:CheY-like chemotaxis protein
VLTDINMPRMDGLSLAESAREWFPKLPVLLMTAHAQSLQNQANSYPVLRKPFLRQALLEAVWKLVTAGAIADYWPESPTNSHASRLQLQEHWQTEVQKAKGRYDECSLHFLKLLEEYNQGLTPAPDGSLAVRQALTQESAARQEYMQALRILTDVTRSDKETR